MGPRWLGSVKKERASARSFFLTERRIGESGAKARFEVLA
jgi:hypothetical protein